MIGGNTGHGHVWARPDGATARCGGPGLCSECSRDQTLLYASNVPGTFAIGDRVEKFTGEARYFGTVVSVYRTLRASIRYVVEVEPQGFQMIVTGSQLQLAPKEQSLG